MKQIVFQESDLAHADRLGLSLDFVRTRRALLVQRLGGQAAAPRQVGYLPERVRQAGAETLLAALDLQIAPPAPGQKADVLLVPLLPVAETA
jgi:hypothetical protein